MILAACTTTVFVSCLSREEDGEIPALENGASPFSAFFGNTLKHPAGGEQRRETSPFSATGMSPSARHTGDALRIDSWLWRTRFYKTRGLAATAVKGGRVHVNGKRVKNSQLLRAADVLQITHPQGDYRLTVLSIPQRRGPAAEVEGCYRIDQLLVNEARRRTSRRIAQASGAPAKRPDKQARRQLRQLKGKL
jgi:ribosome-associated heat shock protein Hsp15